ncbi:DUF1801 domain-containing protein [Sphingobium sp. DEHP117]|uniref:iron chaperone n=1 Tax=Sphingobium sp. DEHP117 TaxID=2993436 RepID=UPI0027D6F061|nr:DUF1801 domain-containing protein [Sphingobium sp. DEHP117]MDQ4418906.1 DUF1801 domain-containing protein [Sphingobium sp. DEHP117]
MTVEEYIASSAEIARPALREIRRMARALCPDAQEAMSYRMPAFRQGRVFLYFGAFRHHIGIYPPVTAPVDLVETLAPYRGPKGNLQFRFADGIPYDVIEQVILSLHASYAVMSEARGRQ